jgi:hypothetical protein
MIISRTDGWNDKNVLYIRLTTINVRRNDENVLRISLIKIHGMDLTPEMMSLQMPVNKCPSIVIFIAEFLQTKTVERI